MNKIMPLLFIALIATASSNCFSESPVENPISITVEGYNDTLDLTGLTSLEYVLAVDVDEIIFPENNTLNGFHLKNVNTVNSVPFPYVRSINIENSGVTDLDLSENTELVNLSIYGAHLTDLDLSESTELELLSISGTQLTELDISQSAKLRRGLNLGGNQLTSVTFGTYENIEMLQISGNRLNDVSTLNAPNIARIYSDNNEFSDFPIENFPQLELIQIMDNPLTIEAMNKFYEFKQSDGKFLYQCTTLDHSDSLDYTSYIHVKCR